MAVQRRTSALGCAILRLLMRSPAPVRRARATVRRAPARSPAPRTPPGLLLRASAPARDRPRAVRRAAARASGSPAGTSSALSSSTRSSRAAGVSAVKSGVPQASAWKALFGITRLALSEVPKMPSAQPARWSSAGRRSYSTQGTHSTFSGRSSHKALELAAADDAEVKVGRGPSGGDATSPTATR